MPFLYSSLLLAKPITSLGSIPAEVKYSQKIQNKAQSISEKEIDLSSKNDVASLLQTKGGLVLKQEGGIGTPVYLEIRGLSSSFAGASLNGVHFNDASTPGNTIQIDGFLLDNVGEIELIKGPYDLKNPNPSPSGLLRLKEKHIPFGTHAYLNQSYGSHQFAHHNVFLSHGSEKVDLSFGGSRLFDEGYESLKNQFGSSQKRNYKNNTARFQIKLRPTQKMSLDLFRFIQKDGQFIDNRYDFHDFLHKKISISKSELSILPLSDDIWSQKIGLSQKEINRQYSSDEKKSTFYKSEAIVLDTHTKLNLHEKVNFLCGAEHQMNHMKAEKTLKHSENQNGYYGSIELSPFTFARNSFGIRKYSHVHHKLGYIFRNELDLIESLLSCHVHTALGFKRPSLYERFDPRFGNPGLSAALLRTYEAGCTFMPFQNNLKTRLAFFRNKLNRPIEFDFDSYRYKTGKRDLNKGLECDIVLTPNTFMNCQFFYQYVKNHEKKLHASPKSPKHIFKNQLGFLLIRDTTIVLNTRYSSRYQSGPLLLKSGLISDFSFLYEVRNSITFKGKIENLFNKKYIEIYETMPKKRSATFGLNISF